MKHLSVTSWSAAGKLVFTLFNLEGAHPKRGMRPEGISGGLAQLGERLPCKQEVSGSIPLISTSTGP